MKATFENTVDILVKAYLNDTLVSGNCSMCAVGNIVHAAGFPFDHSRDDTIKPLTSAAWGRLFKTSTLSHHQSTFQHQPEAYAVAMAVIEPTGYKWQELARIEKAFEISYSGEDPMFNALCAVVDVLAEIHNVDLLVKESAKAMFVKV